MPEHIQYEDDDLFNPETHHESSDVPVKGLLWFLVIFVVFSFLTYIVVLFMYKGFANMERKRMDPPQTAVSRPKSADVPQNQPLLQPFPHQNADGQLSVPTLDTPVADLIKMRAREDELLTNYGWVDQQKGIARIPIEDAKARFAAQIALQGQTGTAGVPATATTPAMTTTAPPSSQPAPSGQPVAADAGIAPTAAKPAGGAHP
jgi:cytoskeletal protein RodZ